MDAFAHGSELTSADAKIRRIELQPVVIRGIQRRDHLDIRVYDANNRPMPAALLNPDATIKTGSEQLKVSALYNNGKISTYIIDRGTDSQLALDSMQFKWKTGKAPKILSFDIEQSADNKSWQPLLNDACVFNLDYKGIRLEHNYLEINRLTKRYLRITPAKEINLPPMSAATATLASKPHADYWWQPVARLEPDPANTGHYVFSLTSGVRPVQFKLSLPLNSAITGALYNYEDTDTKSPVLIAKDFTSYTMSINRNVINAKPVDSSHSSASRWKIATTGMVNIDTENLPGIMAAYPRYKLIFAADGEEPYTLVWGNPDANTEQRGDLAERLRESKLQLNAIPEVSTGLILDHAALAELVASRTSQWPVVISLLVLIVLGSAIYRGFIRRTGRT